MKKFVKMVLYGEPGVGKSTFAAKAPNPYYICSDGNFEWLGLPEENHCQPSSWEEAKKVFQRLGTPEFNWCDTVVVDLTEDFFKWCEYEYCKRNKLDHIGDLGFGKGYDQTRNEFFVEIGKLINLPKHIILIMHGLTTVEKDRRGVEHTKYVPSSRMPDKVLDMIEGRVRYFLRCYMKAEENEDGRLIKKRYLSIVPKENEFGISRGIDEASVPSDIELNWDVFANVIGLDEEVEVKKPTPQKEEKKVEVKKPEVKKPEPKKVEVAKEEQKVEEKVEEPKVEEQPKVKEVVEEDLPKKEEPKKVEVKEEPKVEVKEEVNEKKQDEEKKQLSMADRIAAIKARAAAVNKK